jgi:hypothetical protein
VDGVVNYVVLGWFVPSAKIGFLIPMTIINGAAFITLLLTVVLARTNGYVSHPFRPRPVTYDDHIDREKLVPDEWARKVGYYPTSVRFFRFYCVFFHSVDSSIDCSRTSNECRATSQPGSLWKLLKNKLWTVSSMTFTSSHGDSWLAIDDSI